MFCIDWESVYNVYWETEIGFMYSYKLVFIYNSPPVCVESSRNLKKMKKLCLGNIKYKTNNNLKMRTPTKILIDENNSERKIIDSFDIYEEGYNFKKHAFNEFIACVYKTNKFTWICNLVPHSAKTAKIWIQEKSDVNDDSVLIELTDDEKKLSFEEKKEIADTNIKNITNIHYVQKHVSPKEFHDDTWDNYGYGRNK